MKAIQKFLRVLFTVLLIPSQPDVRFSYFNNWILKNFFNLLIFPVTAVGIIISLYPDDFHSVLIEEGIDTHEIIQHDDSYSCWDRQKYLQISYYAQFFAKNKEVPNKVYLCEPDSMKKLTIFFVIDRTLSTGGVAEGKYEALKEALSKRIDQPQLSKEATLKELLWKYCLHSIFNSKHDQSCSLNMVLRFYDGNTSGNGILVTPKLLETQDGRVNLCGNSGIVKKLLGEENLEQKIDDQKTYINSMFSMALEEVKKEGDSVVLVVLSDFQDEGGYFFPDTLSFALQEETLIEKISLLYLSSGKEENQTRKYLEEFQLRMGSDRLFIENVHLQNYEGEYVDSSKLDNLYSIVPALFQKPASVKVLKAFYPMKNLLRKGVARVRFSLGEGWKEDSSCYWSLRSNYPYLNNSFSFASAANRCYRYTQRAKMAENTHKREFNINAIIDDDKVRKLTIGDTVELALFDENLQDDLYLILSGTKTGKNTYYKIEPYPILSAHAVFLGEISLYFIAIIVVVGGFSLISRDYYYINEYNKFIRVSHAFPYIFYSLLLLVFSVFIFGGQHDEVWWIYCCRVGAVVLLGFYIYLFFCVFKFKFKA